MRALGGVIADTFRTMPYTDIATIANDPADPMPTWRKTTMLKDLSPATIATVLDLVGAEGRAPVTVFEIRQLGGAMTSVPFESTAFSQRYAPFIMQTIGVLASPQQAELVTVSYTHLMRADAPARPGLRPWTS